MSDEVKNTEPVVGQAGEWVKFDKHEQQQEQVQALGLFDAFKLFDKELIDKVLAISKAVQVQHLEDGTLRVTVDFKVK